MVPFWLLDQPAARARAYRFSVEQYHLITESNLIRREIELLDGILVERTAKPPLHVRVSEEITALLRESLQKDWLVRQEQPITGQSSEPKPDLAVVPGTPADYLGSHPKTAELVIEVAVDSDEIDAVKAAIYAEVQVREYWIVLPEKKRVEVHLRPHGREYAERRIYGTPEIAVSERFPAFRLDLAAFFQG